MKEETKNWIRGIFLIVAGFFVILGSLWVIGSSPPYQGGMDVWWLEVEYSDDRLSENITCSSRVFEGMTFGIKFELNKSYSYKIYYGEGDTLDNREIISEKDVVVMFFTFDKPGYIELKRYNSTLGYFLWIGFIAVKEKV